MQTPCSKAGSLGAGERRPSTRFGRADPRFPAVLSAPRLGRRPATSAVAWRAAGAWEHLALHCQAAAGRLRETQRGCP